MDMVELLFIIGNVICFFGTCLLFRRVIKNRNVLKDFDRWGALLTFIPIIIFCLGYILWNNWIALVFALVTLIFWGVVTMFSWKFYFNSSKKKGDNDDKH